MKIIKFLSIILPLSSIFSQIEILTIEKNNNLLQFPHFNDVFDGKIFIDYWKKNNILEINEELKVFSFTISFPSGKETIDYNIVSDGVPIKVIELIEKSCLNEEVFISNIRAINKLEELIIVPSLIIIPIKYEE